MVRRVLAFLVIAAVGVVGAYVLGAWLHLFGTLEGPGEPTASRIPAEVLAARTRAEQRAAARLSSAPSDQILFGDLHVHTTFSTDAFLWSLPMMNGGGSHPLGDACDYARFCSALDFWSITDHAEATSPRKWEATKEAIRQCNAVAGEGDDDPDVAAFLGWEWSQVGRTPADHWGHKNVILRGLGDEEVPARAIGAAGIATDGLRGSVGGMPWYLPLLDFPERQRYFDFIAFMDEVRDVPSCPEGVASPELPSDCYESAQTPADLFRKLNEWGVESMVIPHGNTWGFYSPPGTSWDKQLVGANFDPKQQFIVEIMSGHGNSEEFRNWRELAFDAEGKPSCPEPTRDYLPSCWRAGQIIEARCREEGESDAECETRAVEARLLHAQAGVAGALVVEGEDFEEWLDSGQCKDCFRPSFNYRPRGSTQYALALTNFDDPKRPRRFDFGVIASSDNHRARPGTGYKQIDRKLTTEANGLRDETWSERVYPSGDPEARAVAVDRMDLTRGFGTLEAERQASFFMTGGLAAVHATGRSRDEIWEALSRKEIYGTSGPRILLWFQLLNAERPDGSFGVIPMGGKVRMAENPRFEVRAVGSFVQKPGCPEFVTGALSPEHLDELCRGECYNPSDQRKRITRIEVVRIRPQQSPGEDVAGLIEDPWRVLRCDPDPAGCVAHFTDPDFASSARDAVYYVRAIEEPSPTINAKNLRCEYDAEGSCVKVDPCYGDDYKTPAEDDCTTSSEERAWSSPIFVDAATAKPLATAAAAPVR
jgi:hypothetical protein